MLQLSELETPIRREVNMCIGEGIYNVLACRGVQAAIESIPANTEPFEAEQYMHMIALGVAHPEQPLWRVALPAVTRTTIGRLNEQEAQTISFDGAIASITRRLNLANGKRPEVVELMNGLLIEALEDGLFWTDVMKRTEGLPNEPEKLREHPTILAATSLNHTVHRVVKEVMRQQLLEGLQPVVPRSKEDFVGLYYLAPALLQNLGLKLEINTRETRPAEKSGFCPAKARDAELEQSWLESLQKIAVKFYYRFFREQDYIC